MKKRGRVVSVLLTALMCVSLCSCSVADKGFEREWRTADEMNASYKEAVEKKCRDFIDKNTPVGLAVAVFDHGQVCFLNYGKTAQEGEKITEHTQFEVGSVTKTFTSLLMAQMSVDPAVGLDIYAEAETVLPFQLPEREGHAVELWHLATHTSGLPRMPSNYQESLNPYKGYDLDKLKEYYATAALEAVPGERYAYSNLGFGTLGVALTTAAGVDYDGGKGFEKLLRDRVLQPLHLEETGIYIAPAAEEIMAQPHTALGTQRPVWEFDALAACGALKSTTYDLTQYIAAAMGAVSCDEMLAKAFDMCCAQQFTDESNSVGLGFQVKNLATGYCANWHDGATGGSRSVIIFCEETQQGVVVLCNSAIPVYELGTDILETMQKAANE